MAMSTSCRPCLGVARAANCRRISTRCASRCSAICSRSARRLADPSHKIAKRVEKIVINEVSVARLEGWIDQLDTEIPPLRHFILSDGCPGGALLHLRAHGVPARRAFGAAARQ